MDQSDEADLVELWLADVIHPETMEELPFNLEERIEALTVVARTEPRIANADLLVCSHPTILCILLAKVTEQPIFIHASSVLMYGLPCTVGGLGSKSSLRLYSGDSAQRYLRIVWHLLGQSNAHGEVDARASSVAFLAEGRFLAEQIRRQVHVEVPWAPPLALYCQQRWENPGISSIGSETKNYRRRALVLRARFFVSLMGEQLRSMIRELASVNDHLPLDVTFLGQDKQFDEQWLTLDQIVSYDASILWPNDLHQRTFHEVYKMGVPLFIPDALSLYRAQRATNWGYSSYGGTLDLSFLDGPSTTRSGESKNPAEPSPWWDSFREPPATVLHFQEFADWEQFPNVQRFSSLPGLFDALLTADLAGISEAMLAFHSRLSADSIKVVATLAERALAVAPPHQRS